jgi:hypothetical protein
MKSGQVEVLWLSDEDIENKSKRVSGSTVVCYFTSIELILSGTVDNTTRARDHPVMM